MKIDGDLVFVAQTDQMAGMWHKASPDEQELIAAMHEHYEQEFRRVAAVAPNPESTAHTVNGIVDGFIAEHRAAAPQAKDIRCGRGCAHCCRINVTITLPEAHLLLAWAEDQGIEVDWARVERQAQHPGLAWRELPLPDRDCVFLGKTGDCRVYEHRPVACRKHFVVSDPANCNKNLRARRTLMFVCPQAEVVASAALTAFENRSMPVMLMKARREKEAPAEQFGGA